MLYIRNFENHSDYEGVKTSLPLPNVSFCDDESKVVHYNPYVKGVSGVTLNKDTLSLNVGESETLVATVIPSDASNKSVTWSSNNNNVATVNSRGLVTAVNEGNTIITVTTVDGGYTAQCAVSAESVSDYVEIGGIKWAKKNLGADTITDYGKYYQWADISGYTSDQMGMGEGQKQFDINDYKFWDGDKITKYNDTDGLTTIETEDDAANVELRGDWRMPTIDDYKTLLSATTLSYTLDYMGSGISGMVLTDKTDNTKELFFPSGGYCTNVTLDGLGEYGDYWSASLHLDGANYEGQCFEFYDISDIPEEEYDIDDVISWFTRSTYRNSGLLIRPILLIKENRTLSWVNPPYTIMQGASKTLEAVPSLGVGDGVITYTSDNPSVATVNGNTVTAVADGYCTITATITEGAHYLAATTSFTLSSMGYVEIGGTKWATKNLGADSKLGTGLYFQWADTEGYLDSEVGSGSRYKYFGCADYKYSDGGSCDDFTKYGGTGTELETSDDAATQMLGSDWKIPTVAQYQALLNATSASWTSNYEGSGVAGMVLTDGSNELFFPAVGKASNGSMSTVDVRGWYWANSLATYGASCLLFYNGYRGANSSADRDNGLPIRPVANV